LVTVVLSQRYDAIAFRDDNKVQEGTCTRRWSRCSKGRASRRKWPSRSSL